MSYPYQIKSPEEYRAAYRNSVEDPEGFYLVRRSEEHTSELQSLV